MHYIFFKNLHNKKQKVVKSTYKRKKLFCEIRSKRDFFSNIFSDDKVRERGN